jgi:hypothetical protein
MHQNGAFAVSSAVKPCTEGVDVSSVHLTQEQFMQNGEEQFMQDGDAATNPLITFIDVEGSVRSHHCST